MTGDHIGWPRDEESNPPPSKTKLTQTYLNQESYQQKAIRILFNYIKARLEKTDTHVTFAVDEIYIVWFCKTLQHWKVLLSTTLPDGMYYEVTYNGDKGETYIDAYKKFDNVCVYDTDRPDPEAIPAMPKHPANIPASYR